jgi:hypothetical protein
MMSCAVPKLREGCARAAEPSAGLPPRLPTDSERTRREVTPSDHGRASPTNALSPPPLRQLNSYRFRAFFGLITVRFRPHDGQIERPGAAAAPQCRHVGEPRPALPYFAFSTSTATTMMTMVQTTVMRSSFRVDGRYYPADVRF